MSNTVQRYKEQKTPCTNNHQRRHTQKIQGYLAHSRRYIVGIRSATLFLLVAFFIDENANANGYHNCANDSDNTTGG